MVRLGMRGRAARPAFDAIAEIQSIIYNARCVLPSVDQMRSVSSRESFSKVMRQSCEVQTLT